MMREIYPYMDKDFLRKNNVYLNSLARFSFPYYALSRGLNVSWLNLKGRDKYKSFYQNEGVGGFYTIKSKHKEYSFNFSKLLNTHQDSSIVRKDKLDRLLDVLSIKYPKAITLKNKNDSDKLCKLSLPLVVKPIWGSMGKGVYADIQTKEELEYALSNQGSGIMVEEYIKGDEYRVYILNGNPVAYCKRHSPFIIGDGISTIKSLIQKFNKKKKRQGLVQIKLDDDLNFILKKQNKKLESIPLIDEKIILSNKKGRSSGAIIETVNSINHNSYEALKTLGHYLDTFCLIGVDCIVKDDELFVLEVNLRPQISSALLPDIGPAINIPKLVVDSLFGEYKGNYMVPPNFMNKLRELDKISGFDWEELSYRYNAGFSISLSKDKI